ncbi:Kinetochore protein SPC25 [Plasmodiophora brassicae]|uniref:Kinetochore protein SPC25 n=1 Tax=Plasmodiophora brassicae TaxID=37360 RepID=A0A0G4J3W7_PLABS|nr:hypothetical protein PBRA_002510 [Plasmodiophora brassicae]SPQ93575.1 unnamed protein product [Plasmodiophora brassicae]
MSEKATSFAIKESMGSFREKFDAFVASTEAAMRARSRQHAATIANNENVLAELTDRENRLQDEALSAARAAKMAELEAAASSAKRQQLDSEARSLPKSVESAETSRIDAERRLEQRQAQVGNIHKANVQHLRALSQMILLYKLRLGLDFEVVEEEGGSGSDLRLTFSGLGPRADRTASFTILVADGKYDVKSCHPVVPGVADLLSELNATDDLSWFVQVMRKRFQESFEADRSGQRR